jgi:hypothetical protein
LRNDSSLLRINQYIRSQTARNCGALALPWTDPACKKDKSRTDREATPAGTGLWPGQWIAASRSATADRFTDSHAAGSYFNTVVSSR